MNQCKCLCYNFHLKSIIFLNSHDYRTTASILQWINTNDYTYDVQIIILLEDKNVTNSLLDLVNFLYKILSLKNLVCNWHESVYNLYWKFRPVLLQCKLFWFWVKCTKRYVFSTVNYLINTWKYQYLVYVVAELLQPIWPFYPYKLLAVLVRIWKYFWYQQKINGKSIF